jgi:hypothetical protein
MPGPNGDRPSGADRFSPYDPAPPQAWGRQPAVCPAPEEHRPGDARHAGRVVTSGPAVPSRECHTNERLRRSSWTPALELTEQGTRIADAAGGVTDEAWANAAKHYDEDQLSALVSLIALINTYNRFNVITRQPAGDYQPGQWG